MRVLSKKIRNCLHIAIGSGFPQAALMILDYLQKPAVKEKKNSEKTKESVNYSQPLAALLNAQKDSKII